MWFSKLKYLVQENKIFLVVWIQTEEPMAYVVEDLYKESGFQLEYSYNYWHMLFQRNFLKIKNKIDINE